ncbi:MAG: glycosyltransferase [Saprospiraceae bacterium]|nr:glycosyltransferase [Saprospiraceae bacterium]
MRILVFIREFAAPTLTFVYNEIKAIADQHEVLVMTTERSNEDRFPFSNVQLVPLHDNRFIAKQIRRFQDENWLWAFRSGRIRRTIAQTIQAFKPDLIHVHFGGQGWIFLSNWPENSIPVILSFHGYDASMKLRSARYRRQCRVVLDRKDVTPIFVSNNMSARMEGAIGPIPKHQILYYGTDLAFFKRASHESPQPNPITFLQVSSFTAKKGHIYTIQAFARYVASLPETREVRLILAGDGPTLIDSQRLAQQLGLDHIIEFPGLVTPSKSRELMDSANVFVHHSVTPLDSGDQEGIPNAIMEAMAMELPIVSTLHSGIPELVEDGINGFLVKERDIDAYVQALQTISDWPLQKQNREKVEQLFSRDGHLDHLNDIYERQITRIGTS